MNKAHMAVLSTKRSSVLPRDLAVGCFIMTTDAEECKPPRIKSLLFNGLP
jgi:hypothetical protein